MTWSKGMLGTACVLTLATQLSEAQIVDVRRDGSGSVRVRAPFVRVDVDADGRTTVLAPFTSVRTAGGSRRAAPSEPVPIAELDWKELRQLIRSGIGQLGSELQTIPDGDSFREVLQLALLRDAVKPDTDGPPDAGDREVLEPILEQFDLLANDAQFHQVAGLQGFRTLHAVLAEFLTPALERKRRQLVSSFGALHHELGRFDTGDSWRAYLQLPPEIFQQTSQATSPQVAEERVRSVVARYASVSRERRYEKISRLAPFRMTREQLEDYFQLLVSAPEPAPADLAAPPPPALEPALDK